MTPTPALDDAIDALARGGVELAFGLPGTQSVDLFEALRRSRIRTVLTTHELAAAFCANGAYRATGTPALVLAIPGPGLAFALAGIAEARLDSAALLVLVTAGPSASSVSSRELAAPVAKAFFAVGDDLATAAERALAIATSGEPGPVVVEIGSAGRLPDAPRLPAPDVDAALGRIRAAARPVLFVGQGASGATEDLHHLAERLGAPALVTTSGRGTLAEDHALCLPIDLLGERANELLSACDLVLALGCKLSPNATEGGRIRVPRERLVHVDASREVLASSGASLALEADVPAFLEKVVAALDGEPSRPAWHAPPSLDPAADAMEPSFAGVEGGTARAFFEALRRAAPRDAILVTDSGLHQMLARRWFRVLESRGLLVPADFQSMGFGLPAAIGARLAAPARRVIAIVGDGAMAMSGLELITAVRERVDLTAIVFNDGQLGLIRRKQLADYGRSAQTELVNPDFGALAAATGARHVLLERDAERTLREAVAAPGVTLVEVGLGDSWALRRTQAKSLVRETALGLLARGRRGRR